jgi:hypothetical protein
MESLLLFRRALSSPTMCRFIPALSVPEKARVTPWSPGFIGVFRSYSLWRVFIFFAAIGMVSLHLSRSGWDEATYQDAYCSQSTSPV